MQRIHTELDKKIGKEGCRKRQVRKNKERIVRIERGVFSTFINVSTEIKILGGLKMEKLIRFFKDEEGATAVEYGLIVALIAAVIVAIVAILGGKINTAFKTVSDQLK
jgi:pilus assembly protein Flp/PilA